MDHVKPLLLSPHLNIMNDPEYGIECTHLRYKTKSQNGYGTFPKAMQLVSGEPGFESMSFSQDSVIIAFPDSYTIEASHQKQ